MVAFRVRPREARVARPHIGSVLPRGSQATVGVCKLAGQPANVSARGTQATTGRINFGGVLTGRQVTRSLLTPGILCLGRQATVGLCSASSVSISAFPNGHGARVLVELPAQPDLSGVVTNLVWRLGWDQESQGFVLSGSWLTPFASGGLLKSVVSGVPRDVRLEVYDSTQPFKTGAQLDHQFVAYDAVAGTLDLRVRIPSRDPAVAYRLWLYVGKAGLGASEENPVGLWQGAARAVRYDTGADLTGNGRGFTVSGGTPTTLAGLPALSMAGTNRLQRALAAGEVGLQGLAALTGEFLFQLTAPVPATADGSLVRVGPQQQGGARFSTWLFTTLEYQGGANWYDASTGTQHNCDSATADNVVDGTLTHLFATLQSGQAPGLWRGEAQLATTTNNPPTSGIVNVVAGDYHELGATQWGARADTTPGVYALHVLWPAVLAPAFIALRTRSELQGRSVAGVGSVDLPSDVDASPVAAPLRATNAGAQADYDVLAGCFDPDIGGPSINPLSLVSVGPSSHAGDTAQLVAGMLRYTPQPGWSGTALVPFTISDGAKTSTGLLRVAVAALLQIGYYKTPNIAGKTPVNVTDRASFLAAIAGFKNATYSSTTRYINLTGDVGANGTRGADIVVDAGGTQAHPLVITRTGAGANTWTGVPRVYNSSLVVTQPWVWLYGLWLQFLPTAVNTWNTASPHTACVTPQASRLFVTACRLSCSQGIWHITADAVIDHVTVNYNWFEICTQAATGVGSGQSDFGFRSEEKATQTPPIATYVTGMYNYFNDYLPAIAASKDFRSFIFGNGNADGVRRPTTGTEIGWNFVDASTTHHMEFKCVPDYVHHNHCTGRNGTFGGINTRGGNCDGPASGKRPLFLANRVQCAQWQVNGGYADYVSNWQVDAGGALFGELHLFPKAVSNPPGGKGIAGADATTWVDTKAKMVLGWIGFEPPNYTYGDLGSRAPVLIADSETGTTFVDAAGATVGWSGDPGQATGTHSNLVESAITHQSALPAGFTPEVPPVLSATKVGPGVAGLTWAG